MRQLVIGDIHGCRDELMALLDLAGLGEGDGIIALGDIVDRGPDSPGVAAFFQSRPCAQSLLGNHERKHIGHYRGRMRAALSQKITRRQLGEENYPALIAWLETFPLYRELPEAYLVHGLFEPGVPLVGQMENVLAGSMSGEKHIREKVKGPWYESYDGDRPLIVGHHVYGELGKPLILKDRVFGIDTGCCHGGELTGILLPEFRIISVPARADHWKTVGHQYPELRVQAVGNLSWEKIRAYLANPQRAEEEFLQLLRDADAPGETAVRELWTRLNAEHERILAQLRGAGPYDELEPREQARAYAQLAGAGSLTPYLHQLRGNKLTLEMFRERFDKPGDAVAFLGKP